jgi:phosphoglycolate phosphatase
VLTFFDKKNKKQVILSAMEQDFLTQTLKDKEILDRFSLIYGIRDHLGGGKTDSARLLITELNRPYDKICLIGDTIHDYEVSQELGISCILVAHGHQSYHRLKTLDCLVFQNLQELCDYCSF